MRLILVVIAVITGLGILACTSSPTPTPTPSPTATPTPSPTATPTPSPTATPTPSPGGDLREDPPDGWAAYQNEEQGFRFWYPEGWEQYSPEGIDEEVEFYTGFRDSTKDDFQENILMMVPPYGDMSLASLVDLVNGVYELLGVPASDTETTVNGVDGHEWVVNWPLEGGFTDAGQKQRFVVLKAKGGWYQLRCSALSEQYDAYEDTCDKIIESFIVD